MTRPPEILPAPVVSGAAAAAVDAVPMVTDAPPVVTGAGAVVTDVGPETAGAGTAVAEVRPVVADGGAGASAGGGERRPELPSLTGARWWAAFAVFVLHALVFLPVYPFQKSELFRHIHQWMPMQLGAAGVTFFFVLSGFIIYWSFRPGMPVPLFYRRRVLKIYPTHLVAAAAFVLVAGVPLHRLVVWLPNVLLVHAWVPKWSTVGGLNVPSWSLASEMLFYLSFPLLLPVVRRIPTRRLLLAAVLLVVAVLALHAAFYLWVPGPKGIANAFAPRLVPGDSSPHFELHASQAWFAQPDIPVAQSYWLGYTFPPARLPEFYLGVLTARMVLEGRWRSTRLAPPLLALVVAYAATWVVPIDFKMSALLIAPTAAVVATMAARDLQGIRGWNAHPRMVWFGNISYAFYLIQFPVMVLVTRFLIGGRQFGILGWAGFALLVLVLATAAAAALYHWVDLPIMNRFAGRSAPRAKAPPTMTP